MREHPRRPIHTPREWLRYAAEDLAVAEREAREESPAYDTVCFLCQSATEKFLKGYLIAQGWKLEKTHDIVALMGLCADHDADLGGMADEGAILNEYVVAGRYPGDIAFEQIGKKEAGEALDAARHIRDRVDALMGRRDLPSAVCSPRSMVRS